MWEIDRHACRTCGSAILARRHGTGMLYRCASCAAEALGTPDPICGCGFKPTGPGRRAGGFRCITNPARGPASPAEIVIAFDGIAAE